MNQNQITTIKIKDEGEAEYQMSYLNTLFVTSNPSYKGIIIILYFW